MYSSTLGARADWSSTPCPSCFTPGNDWVPTVQQVGVATGPVWTGAKSLVPIGIRSLNCQTHSESLCRLSYPSSLMKDISTLPSGHTEMRDCYPMRCWRVTHFYDFLYDVLQKRLIAGLAHFLLQGNRKLGAGCLGLKLQINRPVMTPYF
jgi:hypothetical protein